MFIALALALLVLGVGMVMMAWSASALGKELGKAFVSGSIVGLSVLTVQLSAESRMASQAEQRSLQLALSLQDDLQGIDLEGKDVSGQYLSLKNLTDANLDHLKARRTNFNDSQLHFADVTDADLSSSSLNGTELHGADLTNADLTCALLTGTYFSGELKHNGEISGPYPAVLTGATFTNVFYDDSTTWPEGFRPPPSLSRQEYEINCNGQRPPRSPDPLVPTGTPPKPTALEIPTPSP